MLTSFPEKAACLCPRHTSPCWKNPHPAKYSLLCPASRCCTQPPCTALCPSIRFPNGQPRNNNKKTSSSAQQLLDNLHFHCCLIFYRCNWASKLYSAAGWETLREVVPHPSKASLSWNQERIRDKSSLDDLSHAAEALPNTIWRFPLKMFNLKAGRSTDCALSWRTLEGSSTLTSLHWNILSSHSR